MPACRGRVREVEKFFCRHLSSEKWGPNCSTDMPRWSVQVRVRVRVRVCVCVCVCACAATHRKLRVCTSVNFPLLPNSLGLSLSSVACRQPRSGRVPVQARIHFQLWWNVNSAPIAAPAQRYQCQHSTRSWLHSHCPCRPWAASSPVTWSHLVKWP